MFAHLRRLVEELPPRRREVISLKYFGGLQNREIAAVLGLDERTVASNLSRALNDLEGKYRATDVITHERIGVGARHTGLRRESKL